MLWERAYTVPTILSLVVDHDTHGARTCSVLRRHGLAEEEASTLHHKYYSQYGLAIRGLVRHHQIGASHASNAVQVPVCD